MKSRMERYYNEEDTNKRTDKNKNLYREIYDNNDYSSVEGIIDIKQDKTINLEKIRELINKQENKTVKQPVIEEIEILEEKNYDINDVLVKARTEKPDTSKYDMTKNTEIPDGSVDIESIIESLNDDGLLDDLKTETNLPNNVHEQSKTEHVDVDKSFYTASLGIKQEDYEDQPLKIKGDTATKVLIGILVLVILVVAGLMVFLFMNGQF